MVSNRSRALRLGLWLLVVIAAVLSADLLGLTAVVVVLLVVGVGIELFFWVAILQRNDTDAANSSRR